jgi:uncharacterized protein (TIGR00299 family) protein
MRLAYLDTFAGISGDMLLGALVAAGVPLAVLEEATAALALDASLTAATVNRAGITATKVDVLEAGKPAETPVPAPHVHPHRDPAPETTALHPRSLTDIRALITAASLTEAVKALALRAFELLGEAEARIHNVALDAIHFHEVGAVDAIVDIVASAAGILHLDAHWHCAPLNVGSGMVRCAHGVFPVPAPATADLLRGVPTYSAHVQKELVTPTGAAIVRALAPTFGPQPAMRVDTIGYGAGTRNPEGFPNVLRLSLGETTTEADSVTVLETALDDCSPQVLAFVAEQALALGALDVMQTPVVMKKGRAATLLTVLCHHADAPALERLLLAETTTLGVRTRQDRRVVLDRSHKTVTTAYGKIRIKRGSLHGEELNAQPEFEDCRRAALAHSVPLKVVRQAAITAYRNELAP